MKELRRMLIDKDRVSQMGENSKKIQRKIQRRVFERESSLKGSKNSIQSNC